MTGLSLSWRLLRRKGLLLKNALFFLVDLSSPGVDIAVFVGFAMDFLVGVASTLDIEVGLDTSLWESRLEGRYALVAELRSEGGPVRQNIVIPSFGYELCGTDPICPCCSGS